jgi:multidrug resistance efflux pump
VLRRCCDFSHQGMVPRAELLAAIAEIKAARDEARAKEAEARALEDQLARSRDLLKSAQLAMCEMVPRADLLVVKARVDEAEAQIRANGERQRESMEELKEQGRQYQEEIGNLRATMLVCPA